MVSTILRTFAPATRKPQMQTEQKRHLAAWALLSVFVPMLLLSALHVHHDATTADNYCVECVNHVPHSGHLTPSASTLTDCVLCQFFSLQYQEAALVLLIVVSGFVVVLRRKPVTFHPTQHLTLYSTRAPPFVW